MPTIKKTILRHKNRDNNVTTLILPVTHIDSLVFTDSNVEKQVSSFGKAVTGLEIAPSQSLFGRTGLTYKFWDRTSLNLAAPVGDPSHTHSLGEVEGLTDLLTQYADLEGSTIKDSQMPDGIRGGMRYKGGYAFGSGTGAGSLHDLITDEFASTQVNTVLGTFFIATNTNPVTIPDITEVSVSGKTVTVTLLKYPEDMLEQGDWVVCVQATNTANDPEQTPDHVTIAFVSKKEQAASAGREGMVLLADPIQKDWVFLHGADTWHGASIQHELTGILAPDEPGCNVSTAFHQELTSLFNPNDRAIGTRAAIRMKSPSGDTACATWAIFEVREVSTNKSKRDDLLENSYGVVTEALVKKTVREFSTTAIPTTPAGRFISTPSAPFLLGVYDTSNIEQSEDYIQGAPLIRTAYEGWSYVIPYRFENGAGADFLRQIIPFEIILHNHKPSGDFHEKVYNSPSNEYGDKSNPYYLHYLTGASLWGEEYYRSYHFLDQPKDTLVEVNYSELEGQQRYYVQFKRLMDPLSAPTVSVIIKQHQAIDDTPRYVLYRLRPSAFEQRGDYCYIVGNASDGNPPMDLNAQVIDDTSTTNHGWVMSTHGSVVSSDYSTSTFKLPDYQQTAKYTAKQIVGYKHILAPANTYLDFD